MSVPAYYIGRSGQTVWEWEWEFSLSRRMSDAVEYIVRAGKKPGSTFDEDCEKAVSCIRRAQEERRLDDAQAGGK